MMAQPARHHDEAGKLYSPAILRWVSDHYFSNKISQWFKLWDHEIDKRGALDISISQTNLFTDQSKNFNKIRRKPECWEKNVKELAETLVELKPSGILFFSIPTMKNAFWYANKYNISLWHDVFDRNSINEDNRKRFGRFHILPCKDSALRCDVAGVTHSAARGIANEDVESAKRVMKPWIRNIVTRIGQRG